MLEMKSLNAFVLSIRKESQLMSRRTRHPFWLEVVLCEISTILFHIPLIDAPLNQGATGQDPGRAPINHAAKIAFPNIDHETEL
jgi:hypothetical protein